MTAVALEELRSHAAELGELYGVAVDIDQSGSQVFIIARDVALPAGRYLVTTTDILLITDTQYPLSAMDMFWTDPAVLCVDGSVPASAESIETHAGREWRRFSWHRNGWKPAGNALVDHFAFCQARFSPDIAP